MGRQSQQTDLSLVLRLKVVEGTGGCGQLNSCWFESLLQLSVDAFVVSTQSPTGMH